MTNMNVNVESELQDMRRNLASATAHIAASLAGASEIQPMDGLVLACEVEALGEFMLDYLPDDNFERAAIHELVGSARKLLARIRRHYGLCHLDSTAEVHVIEEAAHNGNGKPTIKHIQPTENFVKRQQAATEWKGGRYKLNATQVHDIRVYWKEHSRHLEWGDKTRLLREIAEIYHVSPDNVKLIVTGKSWPEVK